MSNKVNILINGKPAGEQSIPGSMRTPDQQPASTTTSRVLVNGVPTTEETRTIPPRDEFPPLPAEIAAKVSNAKAPAGQSLEQTFDYGDSFSLAENYLQWQNLKQNHALDKMFLASTPDALGHLHTLHKYIGEVLNLEKQVPKGVTKKDDGPEPEDEGENSQEEEDFAAKLAKRLSIKKSTPKGKPGPKPKDL